uniref:Uncharacterized protein n=1 Tax=Panagrolaimus superbus TaxID=310955 RepID=A0A914Z6D0_9BILA
MVKPKYVDKKTGCSSGKHPRISFKDENKENGVPTSSNHKSDTRSSSFSSSAIHSSKVLSGCSKDKSLSSIAKPKVRYSDSNKLKSQVVVKVTNNSLFAQDIRRQLRGYKDEFNTLVFHLDSLNLPEKLEAARLKVESISKELSERMLLKGMIPEQLKQDLELYQGKVVCYMHKYDQLTSRKKEVKDLSYQLREELRTLGNGSYEYYPDSDAFSD